MPLHVVGEHAHEDMRADPLSGVVVDRAHLEVHGLEAAEGAFDGAQALVGAHGLLGVEFARRHAGAHHVQPVQGCLRGDGMGFAPVVLRSLWEMSVTAA